MITPSWLSGWWRSFLYSYSVYSCHIFLISSASVRSIPLLYFIVPVFAWNVSLVFLIFLKISPVSHSIAFLYFSALIPKEGFLISPCYSLELCIQISVSFLFSFAFLHFFFLGMVLITASCIVSGTSVHSYSGTLSVRPNPLNLLVTSTV